ERRPEVVALDRLPLVEDQLVPLEGLEREEEQAAENREGQEALQALLVPASYAGERLHHRDAAAHEQERHRRSELDAEDARRDGPGRIAVAQGAVRGEDAAEGHGVRSEKYPHPKLSPALGSEGRFGGLHAQMIGCDGGTHPKPPWVRSWVRSC